MDPNTENATAVVVADEAQDAALQEAPAIIEDASTAAPAPAPASEDKPEDPAKDDPESYVRFHKPYFFEGNYYAGIDLKAVENLTAKDMCEAEKYLSKKGIISPLPEMTMEYIGFIANRATGQPIEFFMKLPPKDATKVKNRVTSFFYGED